MPSTRIAERLDRAVRRRRYARARRARSPASRAVSGASSAQTPPRRAFGLAEQLEQHRLVRAAHEIDDRRRERRRRERERRARGAVTRRRLDAAPTAGANGRPPPARSDRRICPGSKNGSTQPPALSTASPNSARGGAGGPTSRRARAAAPSRSRTRACRDLRAAAPQAIELRPDEILGRAPRTARPRARRRAVAGDRLSMARRSCVSRRGAATGAAQATASSGHAGRRHHRVPALEAVCVGSNRSATAAASSRYGEKLTTKSHRSSAAPVRAIAGERREAPRRRAGRRAAARRPRERSRRRPPRPGAELSIGGWAASTPPGRSKAPMSALSASTASTSAGSASAATTTSGCGVATRSRARRRIVTTGTPVAAATVSGV